MTRDIARKHGKLVFESVIITAIIFIIISICLQAFIGPHYEAKIYNKKYGTDYSGWDFMFAGGAIRNYVGPGEQSTINLNMR